MSLRPFDREIDQERALEDPFDQTAILEVVPRQIPGCVAIQASDLSNLFLVVFGIVLDELASPEELARHSVQPKVLEAPRRRSQRIDAVEHGTTGDASDAFSTRSQTSH